MTFRLLVLTVAILLPGCSNPGTATLSGKVTFEGEPIGDGMVTLVPTDGKGPVVGGRIKNGEFRIENLTPGPKTLKVEAVKAVPFARSSEEMAQRVADNARTGDSTGLIDPADALPADAVGNNAQVEIRVGQNAITLALKKPRAN